MSVIGLQRVSAGHNGIVAIHDVSLTVEAGEIVAVLGANGAGKTTLARAVCGLAEVFGGSVELFGREATSLPPRRRARLGLGTVPDDRGVFGQLTVAENLRLGGGGNNPRALLATWFPELEPLLDRRAGLLSGGEQTLLALARALIGRPRALVVDELTTGLAPAIAESTFALLRRVADERGTGVLVVEQSARLALGIADTAFVMGRGRVVLEGVAADISARPDVLEASYLGEVG
jgi:branched-chain amino acid transport system ATP-binding protein